MCDSPVQTWLMEYRAQIRHELSHHHTKNIVQLGAADPTKWAASSPDEIPTDAYWSWLVNCPDSRVLEAERELYQEDLDFREDFQQMVCAVLAEFADAATCSDCDYFKPVARKCLYCEAAYCGECQNFITANRCRRCGLLMVEYDPSTVRGGVVMVVERVMGYNKGEVEPDTVFADMEAKRTEIRIVAADLEQKFGVVVEVKPSDTVAVVVSRIEQSLGLSPGRRYIAEAGSGQCGSCGLEKHIQATCPNCGNALCEDCQSYSDECKVCGHKPEAGGTC